MKTQIRYDYPCVPVGEEFTIRMLLSLKGERRAEKPVPLDISLVLDRSGSMGGGKLKKVLAATRMMAGQLTPEDILSLVTFSNTVDTHINRAGGDGLEAIDHVLAGIRADGQTFLSGGYCEGVRLAAASRSKTVSRVFLLSDGHANKGVSDIAELAVMAAGNLRENVSTTTFGVGDDFDEELMTGMASSGGGNSYYIDDPEHAAVVFREELQNLRQLYALGCTVRFRPAEGVSAASLSLFGSMGHDGDCWLVGDVSSSEESRLVLELTVPAAARPVQGCLLGELELQWISLKNGRSASRTLEVRVDAVSPEKFQAVRPDNEVIAEAAFLTAGRAKLEARSLADRRCFDEAAELLERYASSLDALGLNDSRLNEEIAALRSRAERIRLEREHYYSARTSKMLAYESYNMIRSKKQAYESMRQRMAETE